MSGGGNYHRDRVFGQSESGVNYVGGIIAEIFESEFERILNNDHTGVADDAGAVTWLGDFLGGSSGAASAES